jgi:transposase
METSRAAVPVVELAPVPEAETKRRRRSVRERRQIVEETLVPGASVARVARAHGVNANRVFYWRALYRRERLGEAAAGAALLAVTISEPPVSEAPAVTASSGCTIEPESGPDPLRAARRLNLPPCPIHSPRQLTSAEDGCPSSPLLNSANRPGRP